MKIIETKTSDIVTLRETADYSISMPYELYLMLRKFHDRIREYDCTVFAQFVDASRGLGYIADDMKTVINAEKCRLNPFMRRMVISNEDMSLDGIISLIDTMKAEMTNIIKDFSEVMSAENSIERHYQESIVIPESVYKELTGYRRYYDKVSDRLDWVREKFSIDKKSYTWMKGTVDGHMNRLMGLCMFVKDYAKQCDSADGETDGKRSDANPSYREMFGDAPATDKLLVSMYGGKGRFYGE